MRLTSDRGSVIHVLTMAVATANRLLLLLHVDDRALGREEQARDARRVLRRDALDLGRHDDGDLHQVLALAGGGAEAEAGIASALNLLGNQTAAETTVRRDQIDPDADVARLTASSANP
jgi:hypothetical protein